MTATRTPSHAARPLPAPWFTRRGLRLLVIGYVVLVAAGWLAAAVHGAVVPDWQTAGADARVAETLATGRDPLLLQALQVVSLLGKIWIVAPLVAVIGLLGRWRTGSWNFFWLPAAAGAGGFAISVAVKFLTARPRPPMDLAAVSAFGPSFPSGHVIRVTAVYGAVAWLVWMWARRRTAGVAAWLGAASLALATGFARLYEAAHWLVDVMVSYGLATAWLAVVLAAGGLLPRAGGGESEQTTPARDMAGTSRRMAGDGGVA